ncbi:MAG: DinB family protein [Saprospiraceae bacterium]|nr:DinB family protein [Saprospiraceae bacterium]
MEKYRDQGAIGALLDEYERAISHLKAVIKDLNPDQLTTIVDPETNDPDCKSIQTILTHVVRSGYGYAIVVRKHLGEDIDYLERVKLKSSEAYQLALTEMFAYNEKLFQDYPNLVLEEYDDQKKILVRWGQKYDVEQLFEHAIVHIMRHRRQIERFLIRLSNK